MPTLVVNHEDPTDIRNSMALLAKLLPDETMFLVNTGNTTDIQQLITTLQGYLPDAAPSPYDEVITLEMLTALAKAWPNATPTFIRNIETDASYSLTFLKITCDGYKGLNILRNVYKGHVFHPVLQETWKDIFEETRKRERFWLYVHNEWNLSPTPEGWIPPDMR